MPDCRTYQPGRLNGFPVDAVHWLATYGRDEMGQPMPSRHGVVRLVETRTSTTFYWAERDAGDYEGRHRDSGNIHNGSVVFDHFFGGFNRITACGPYEPVTADA